MLDTKKNREGISLYLSIIKKSTTNYHPIQSTKTCKVQNNGQKLAPQNNELQSEDIDHESRWVR